MRATPLNFVTNTSSDIIFANACIDCCCTIGRADHERGQDEEGDIADSIRIPGHFLIDVLLEGGKNLSSRVQYRHHAVPRQTFGYCNRTITELLRHALLTGIEQHAGLHGDKLDVIQLHESHRGDHLVENTITILAVKVAEQDI
jgi:hypothetical protein